MGELNIAVLIGMIRDFDAGVIDQWIWDGLEVSESTYYRCKKSGIWPRSVKRKAMVELFDQCRDRFFGGNGDALAKTALEYLEGCGIDASGLVEARAQGGYDAFVKELVAEARDSRNRDGEMRSSARPGFSGPAAAFLVAMVLVAVLLFVGLLNIPLGGLIAWAA